MLRRDVGRSHPAFGTAVTAVPFPPSAQPAPGAVVAEFRTTTGFGFMTMDREGAGWTARAYDYDGKLMTTCMLAGRKISCTPIASAAAKP